MAVDGRFGERPEVHIPVNDLGAAEADRRGNVRAPANDDGAGSNLTVGRLEGARHRQRGGMSATRALRVDGKAVEARVAADGQGAQHLGARHVQVPQRKKIEVGERIAGANGAKRFRRAEGGSQRHGSRHDSRADQKSADDHGGKRKDVGRRGNEEETTKVGLTMERGLGDGARATPEHVVTRGCRPLRMRRDAAGGVGWDSQHGRRAHLLNRDGARRRSIACLPGLRTRHTCGECRVAGHDHPHTTIHDEWLTVQAPHTLGTCPAPTECLPRGTVRPAPVRLGMRTELGLDAEVTATRKAGGPLPIGIDLHHPRRAVCRAHLDWTRRDCPSLRGEAAVPDSSQTQPTAWVAKKTLTPYGAPSTPV